MYFYFQPSGQYLKFFISKFCNNTIITNVLNADVKLTALLLRRVKGTQSQVRLPFKPYRNSSSDGQYHNCHTMQRAERCP